MGNDFRKHTIAMCLKDILVKQMLLSLIAPESRARNKNQSSSSLFRM